MSNSLRPKQAAEFLGIKSTAFYKWRKERADFPKGRRLSARCVVFDQSELAAWRDAQPTASGVA
jgi:predicted DNA-binding transcriptional regulator AlpA